MKYLFILVCCLSINTVQCYSQSISMQTIAAAGSLTSDSPQLDWTVGEMMVASYNNNQILTQGLHQGKLIITDIKTIDPDIKIDIYPNPVVSIININFNYNTDLEYIIRNIQGKTIDSNSLNGQHNQIDVESLRTGTYILSFFDENRLVKTAKIIKID